MSASQTFICLRYVGKANDNSKRVVMTFDTESIKELRAKHATRSPLFFHFDFSEQGGKPLYVLFLYSPSFTSYGFFDAEKTVDFAKAVLPHKAQMKYDNIPSLEFCDKLARHFYNYFDLTRYVNFCRKCHASDPVETTIEPADESLPQKNVSDD